MEIEKLKKKIYAELKKGVRVSPNDIALQYEIEEMTAAKILEELKEERKVELTGLQIGTSIDYIYMKR